MATEVFAQTNKEIDSYLYAYKNILSAVGFVNLNTGETIKLSAEQKIIWLYILSQYKFFKDEDRLYFENQADIALACGVAEKTVSRFINTLSDAVDENGKKVGSGYLQISQTRRFGGRKSNSYVLLSDLVLVQPEKVSNKPVQAISSESDAMVAPTHETPSKELIERYIENNNSAGEEWATESIPYDDAPVLIVDSSEEDDGSIADARDYVEERPIGNASRPQIRYQSNGKSVDEHTYKANQPNKRESNGCILYEIAGELHTLENGCYVPASTIDIALFETGLPF
ncbi:hypothetical protein DFO61_2033 [Ectopseudomonas oleovorans]|uniref:DUF6945 domain-containing protein n=1 Tax=Ectopseudomonas oleovorans TaxID=301 RepID=A0A397N837_ECTOL|nr:hypothetical protein [Pseudomonas oleovorans]RIA31317.1 hypothetical protein DFO61_2033 [Pseudomonas oleovorans]